jgi:hypothetical protein
MVLSKIIPFIEHNLVSFKIRSKVSSFEPFENTVLAPLREKHQLFSGKSGFALR